MKCLTFSQTLKYRLEFDESIEKGFDKYSKIPIVSTISGSCRVIYCIALLVFNNLMACFSTDPFLCQFYNVKAIKNIPYGIIEAVPFIGNVLIALFEFKRDLNRMGEMDIDY